MKAFGNGYALCVYNVTDWRDLTRSAAWVDEALGGSS